MCKCSWLDTSFFVLFFCLLLTVLACLIFTWSSGDTRLLLYNIDSEGNLCGQKSDKLDLTDKPFLFLFDSYFFPHVSYSYCVKTCPSYDLKSKLDVFSYANSTNNTVCSYSTPISKYFSLTLKDFDRQGVCPMLPVLKSTDYLNVCVPEIMKNSGQALAFIDLVVPLLNQCFRSIYNYWAFSAIAVVSSFFLASLLCLLLRCLYKCILASILPLIICSIGVGLGALWFAYHSVCKRLSFSVSNKLPLNSFEVYNEVALLVFAVVLTIILSLLICIVIINCRSFPSEIDPLFSVYAKFMDSSKMLIWLPFIASMATMVIVCGAVAAAFCALSLIEVEPKQTWDFYKLPTPPYKERPERAGIAYAVVLALFWLPRIAVNAVKLSVHLSASEYLELAMMDLQPKEFGYRPSWFSLMSTAVTMSFVECFYLPVSFVFGFLLALFSPFEASFSTLNGFLRAATYWIHFGYACQASVSPREEQHHTTFYKAVHMGLSKINMLPTYYKQCNALVAGEWLLLFCVTAIFSLPIGVVILQMRYATFLSLSTPSVFLVAFFGYWIAASSLAPFSASFTTFCLNYNRVSQIMLNENNTTMYEKTELTTTTKTTNKTTFTANKQNTENWLRQQQQKA